jgi:hypothetical protein
VGACPGDDESAGVNYSHRSPKGNRHMRRLLNQAANAAVRTKGSIFEIVYRRSVPRLGHNQAIGAIAHRLVHFAVTANPTAEWTARQLLQAFPWDHAPRYLLRDRDRAYELEFSEMAKLHGHSRSPDCTPESLAKRPSRATHRIDSTTRQLVDRFNRQQWVQSWRFLKLAACITYTRAKLPDRSGLPKASRRM